MSEQFDPDEALAVVRDARERLAANNAPPSWYAPIYGVLCGGVVAGGGLAQPFGILLVGVSIAGLGILYRTWSEAAGISLNGYRPGRTRTIAIGLAVLLVAMMLGGLVLRVEAGLGWAPLALGAVAMPIAALASSLWDRAWRDQVTGRGQ
jgi:hypothetical protein